jgi:hypothetical protein
MLCSRNNKEAIFSDEKSRGERKRAEAMFGRGFSKTYT